MSVIRFEPNVPVEVALKFDDGKRVQSRIPDAPDQMMYTVSGDDTIYLPLRVAAQIAQLGIKKMELISICKCQQGGVARWEVKQLRDAAQTASEPPAIIEHLTNGQSKQQQASRALSAPAAPQRIQAEDPGIHHSNSTPAPIAHTVISKLMAASLIAAFDAAQEAERYAHIKGFEIEFGSEDIRAISNTIFIALSKDPAFAQPQKANGGAQLWQQ